VTDGDRYEADLVVKLNSEGRIILPDPYRTPSVEQILVNECFGTSPLYERTPVYPVVLFSYNALQRLSQLLSGKNS